VELTPHVDAIRGDLASLLGGDPGLVEALERLDRALEASIQLRLLDALGQAAQELAEAVPGGRIDVRLAGRDAAFVFTAEAGADAPASADADDAGTARLTLRIPESLKARVEEAASREGLSVNAWIVRAITVRFRSPTQARSGRRITGYART
jgi:hypothetical protein